MICVLEKKGGDEERERGVVHTSRVSFLALAIGTKEVREEEKSISHPSLFSFPLPQIRSANTLVRSDQASVRKWVAQERDAI